MEFMSNVTTKKNTFCDHYKPSQIIKKHVAKDLLRRPMRRQMGVANVRVANTFCDHKITVANYLRPPNLHMAIDILQSLKSLKNAYNVLATILLPSQKILKKKKNIKMWR